NDLLASGSVIDACYPSTNAVAHPDIFARNHLGARQPAFDLAGINNGVAFVHALDRTGNDGFAPFEKVIEHLLTLGVADLLKNCLLGCLGADATKFLGFQRLLDVLTHFDVGNNFQRVTEQLLAVRFLQAGLVRYDQPAAKTFVFPGLTIDRNANIGVFLETLLHGGGQRTFKRSKNHFTFDILFTRQGVDQKKNFATHRFFPLKSKMGSSFARSTSSNVKSRTCSSPFWVSNSRPKTAEPAS